MNGCEWINNWNSLGRKNDQVTGVINYLDRRFNWFVGEGEESGGCSSCQIPPTEGK